MFGSRSSDALARLPSRILIGVGCLLFAGADSWVLPRDASAAAEHRHVNARTGLLEIPLDELVGAVRRKDRAEIGRVAERLGPARLADALRRPDVATVNAALMGILVLPGRERLIGSVTDLVTGGGDPALALAGLRTLGEILAPLTPADLDDWEVPPDLVKSACAAMRVTVVLAANPTANRLAALDALADASVACSPTADIVALLRDPTPAIRRAAALVLRPQQRLATGGFASGIRDIDRLVASASVAALCESMAVPGPRSASAASSREPVWEQTRQAARRMVAATDIPPEDAVQMLDCLDPSLAADRQMLERFRGRRRTPVGDRASEIMGSFGNRTRP